jgi:hypothetical protein
MSDAWDKRAARVQASVRESELENPIEYSERETRSAIIHTREDIVLVVSNLSSANGQLSMIKGALVVVALILLYIAYRLS